MELKKIKCVMQESSGECSDATILGTVENGQIVLLDRPARLTHIGSGMIAGWANCHDDQALHFRDPDCGWSVYLSRDEAKRIGLQP